MMDSKKLNKCNFLCKELLLTENRHSNIRHLKNKQNKNQKMGMFVYQSSTDDISNHQENCLALNIRAATPPELNQILR